MRSDNTRQYLANIATNVSRLRHNAQLSLEQLADMAFINAMHLYSLEGTGRVNPTVDLLVALADALGVDPISLLQKPPASGQQPESAAAGHRRRARQIWQLAAERCRSSGPARAARAVIGHLDQALTSRVARIARRDC